MKKHEALQGQHNFLSANESQGCKLSGKRWLGAVSKPCKEKHQGSESPFQRRVKGC